MNSRIFIAAGLAAIATSGCGITINAVETVSDTVQTITDVTSSTFGGSDKERSAAAFIDNNFDTLSAQAARGGGKAVDSLAELLGEPHADDFGRWLQMNYEQVFSDKELTLQRIQAGRNQTSQVAFSN